MKACKHIILCLALLPVFPAVSHAGVIFVKYDAIGANYGTSWTDAYTSIQTALAAASALDEIWVAAGTYTPTDSSDRFATFQLINGVALYGGFAGTENSRQLRDWNANETILSGAIGNPVRDDNSLHVVTANDVDTTTILDGFTITGGYASDDNPGNPNGYYGGGILIINSSPTIVNTIIRNNLALLRGGGILLILGGTPSFTNVTFSNNASGGSFDNHHYYGKGGGMYTDSGHPAFSNVSFISNYSKGAGAGLLCKGHGTLIDCEFFDNEGDAVKFELSGTAIIERCVISDNDGSGIVSGSGTHVTLRNSALSGNGGGGAIIRVGSVENTLFQNNSGAYGGGMRIGNDVTITNAAFIDNTALEGNGIYMSYGSAVLTNVTFAHNTSPFGAAIRVVSGEIQIHNAIVWGNNVPPTEIDPGASLTFSHSLVEGSGGSSAWIPSIGTDGGNNIDADPLYADASALDMRLSAGSPAINAGDNSAPYLLSTDLDGRIRIAEGTVDMGAYEFTCPAGSRLYVNAGAFRAGDGTSWSEPFTALQQALVAACSTVTEIWVAAGTYVPTTSTDRYRSFRLRNGLSIYGGFAGTEASFHQRNLAIHPTVLSGDIASGDQTDNSYHVMTGSGTDSTAVLDGFIITGGYADGDSPHNSGGGMINVTGSPTVRNVHFVNNVAVWSGGAMYNYINSRTHIVNTVFWDNWGMNSGGAVHNVVSNPWFTNATFHGNYSLSGGGMLNSASDPIMINTISSGNDGGEIINVSSNPVISYSLIQGSGGSESWNPAFGIDGGNNIDADPLFTDAANGDFTLGAASPAINSGDNAATQLPSTDIHGRPRIINIIVDMGAHESGIATGFGEEFGQGLPSRPILASPFPNPFNPSITIRYEMDRARRIELSVFSVKGFLVRRLLSEIKGPGLHHALWNGFDDAGKPVASGVYFFRLSSGNHVVTKKAVLLR
jgi:hypothetical protein